MFHQSVQLDPLNSPHPIPWNWVMATLTQVTLDYLPKVHSYRSQSLVSPDGRFAAYSRIQVQVHPQSYQSRVSSVMFLENLETGDLQTVIPKSPFADNPFIGEATELCGTISIVIPVSWSARGDRLLARTFEAQFNSDTASDYAVIVDRPQREVSTVAPIGNTHSHAILLGWSESQPDRALFQAGDMGERDWKLWTVSSSGQTVAAMGDRPITFGQAVPDLWMGPQAHEC